MAWEERIALEVQEGKKVVTEYPLAWQKNDLNFVDHLINFHRLPTQIAGAFAVGKALGGFMKDHPEFSVGIPVGKVEKK